MAGPVGIGRWHIPASQTIRRRQARKARRARWGARGHREVLAEWTGLEPATPGVTGRYSNQLNYHSDKVLLSDLNPSHGLVGAEGFEPPTFAL